MKKYKITIDFFKQENNTIKYYAKKRKEAYLILSEFTNVEMPKHLNSQEEIDKTLEVELQPCINSNGVYILKSLNQEIMSFIKSYTDYKVEII